MFSARSFMYCLFLGVWLTRVSTVTLFGADLVTAVQEAGGKVEFASDDPELIVGIDLYNGNNPLKGKGGKNEVVNDAWLEQLAGQKSLKKLSLANCAVTNTGMKIVGQLTSLEELNLTLTAVSDDGLRELGALTKLKSLGLASSQCTGVGFDKLKQLKQLENVNFHFTPLNDEGLCAISAVGVKGRLWFAHVKFTDVGAKALSQLKQLKACGIGSIHPDSSGEAVAALKDLPLEDLSLLDQQASAEGLTHAAAIRTLKRLDASHAPKATDVALAALAKLPQLEEFRLGSANEVTDAGIAHFAATTSLKKLSLQNIKKLTASGIAALQKSRPDLTIEVK
jgi:hypothetical protein